MIGRIGPTGNLVTGQFSGRRGNHETPLTLEMAALVRASATPELVDLHEKFL